MFISLILKFLINVVLFSGFWIIIVSHDIGLSNSNSKKASAQLCWASCHVDGESSYKLVHKKSSLKLLDEEQDIGLKNFNFPFVK